MTTAYFRFYAELNELLPENKRKQEIPQKFKGPQSVKHLIESLGIPHTEIDLILVNNEPVTFSYIPKEGERISVFPVFESFNISPINRLRPTPLRDTKFVLDGHLGRLAAYLRMLGFDALYRNDFSDEELANISSNESRILLTRDRGLLKRSQVTHGFLITQRQPKQQLVDVVRRFDLAADFKEFSRCMSCNGKLVTVKKDDVVACLEPRTKKYFDEFRRCEHCGKVYWRGSHYERMIQLIEWIRTLNFLLDQPE